MLINDHQCTPQKKKFPCPLLVRIHLAHLANSFEMAIIESTASSAKSVRKENSVARIVGSGSAGILELALFHPVPPTSKDKITDRVGRHDRQAIDE